MSSITRYRIQATQPCDDCIRDRIDQLWPPRRAITAQEIADSDLPRDRIAYILISLLPDHQQSLFAWWCVRQAWDALTDERSRRAVEVAEQLSDPSFDPSDDNSWLDVEKSAWEAYRDMYQAAIRRLDMNPRAQVQLNVAKAAARLFDDASAFHVFRLCSGRRREIRKLVEIHEGIR